MKRIIIRRMNSVSLPSLLSMRPGGMLIPGVVKASQYANGFFLKNFLADDFNSGGARSDQVYAQEIYESAIVATNGWVENYYKRLYATIYLANLVIERFDAAESEVKARNIAEAKFFRAICYFELTTLWGLLLW